MNLADVHPPDERRVSIDGHAGPCEHQSLPLDLSHLSGCSAATASGSFVELDGQWQLLDVPSAFEMSPTPAAGFTKHGGGVIEVVSTAPEDKHELRLALAVLEGAAVRFLISHHVAINGDDGSPAIPVRWEAQGNGIHPRHPRLR